MNKQEALFDYCLRLGDTSLVLGHNLSQWCGHGPILEEDIGMINMALDLVGQSRLILDYAGKTEGKGRTDDDLAYLRDVYDYKNSILTEQPNGDFANTIIRHVLYSQFAVLFFSALRKSKDETLAAFAEKSLKEMNYHLRHAAEWTLRLGDGTEESHRRTQQAVDQLWMYTDDLFEMSEGDALLVKEGIAVDLATLKNEWTGKIKELFSQATLTIPQKVFMLTGSRSGKHTEHLGYLLAELQFMQRAYPGAKW